MSIEDIFKGIFTIIIIFGIFIPVMMSLNAIFSANKCQDYQTKIDQLTNENNRLKSELTEASAKALYLEQKYDNLTKTNITKNDFIELKSQLNVITLQVNNTKSEIYNIHKEIINIKNIKNTYYVLSLLISINFALFGLTILDLTFFRFKYTKKIIDKIFSIRNKTHIEINQK